MVKKNDAPLSDESLDSEAMDVTTGVASIFLSKLDGLSTLGRGLVKMGVDAIYVGECPVDREKISISLARPVARLVIAGHAVELRVIGQASGLSTPIGWITNRYVGDKYSSWVDPSVAELAARETRDVYIPRLNDFHFATGLNLVIAPGNFGKTPMMLNMAAKLKETDKVNVVLFGEPRGEYLTRYEDMLTELMVCLITRTHAFMDSMKNPVYDTEGAAASAGMVSKFWTACSNLSSVFDRCGTVLCAVVNPTTTKAEAVANMIEALKTSANGLIVSETKGNWLALIRTAATGDRNQIDFVSTKDVFSYRGERLSTTVENADLQMLEKPEFNAKITVDERMVNALSRLFTQQI